MQIYIWKRDFRIIKWFKTLYISLSAVFIKKVDNFNKTPLKHIDYAESESL